MTTELSAPAPSAGVSVYARRIAIFAIAATLAIAFLVHAIFINTPGPIYIVDQPSAVWMIALGAYILLQVVAARAFPSARAGACCGCCGQLVRLCFFLLVAVLAFVCSICFFIYGRSDIGIYALLLMASSLLVCDVVRSVEMESSKSSSFTASESDPPAPSAAPSCVSRCLELWNAINLALLLLFLCLQLNAAITQASSVLAYPARGNIVELTLSTGDKQRIHYQCLGPQNSTKPAFLLDGSASHGAVDFWPLQRELVNRGERTCVLDKPGFGYSDNYFAWQNADPQTMYNEFVTQLAADGEGASFVMVGWGGGGGIMYQYALAHPSRTAGFVFLDTAADGIEWRSVAARDSLSQEQLNTNKNVDLAGRSILFAIIRGLGAPWGILSIFVPGDRDAYAWPERFDEYHWNYIVPKTWTTQWFSLLPEFTKTTLMGSLGVFDRSSAALAGLPTLMVATNRTRAAVCKDRTVEQCDDNIFGQNFALAEKQTIANVTGASRLVYCTADDCSLDMPLRLPVFVASAILNQTWTVAP